MNILLQHLHSIYPLSVELSAHLRRVLKKKAVPKRSFLLRPGEVCKHIYFIERGLLRGYRLEGSKEISTWFMRERQMGTSAESFLLQKSGSESIQALEDTVVYSISYEELQQLYLKFPPFNFIGRALAGKYFLQLNQQLGIMRTQTAQERYSWLVKRSPELLLRVPLKYIASYLGISAVMLSRIRARR